MRLKQRLKFIDLKVFLVPAVLVLLVIVAGVFYHKQFGQLVNATFQWSQRYFSWLYALVTFSFIPFCVWAAWGKQGQIRLGGKQAQPSMSMAAWISITFTSGMALGVVFYGVSEGLTNYMTPPPFTHLLPHSAAAAETALQYVYLHWGFQAYGIYTAAGLCFAFALWNLKQKFALNSALQPLLHERANGWMGQLVNWLCLYVLVASLGTNVGLGTLQLSTGFRYMTKLAIKPLVLQILIIAILGIIGIYAACSGIHRGIKLVSNINMSVFATLLAWAFIFGGSVFILNNTLSSIGGYLKNFVEMGLYLEPVKQTGWVAKNTIYYWAWWTTVAPITGLFLARLARGRTIRQFVLVNLLVPVGFIFIWFGTFGSSAIFTQMHHVDIWRDLQTQGYPVAFFAYLNTLPWGRLVMILGLIAVILSFVTQYESMIYSIAEMSVNQSELLPNDHRVNYLKIFWGIAISLMGFILIQSGGLTTVQTSVVVLGIPILLILVAYVFGFVKAIRRYDETMLAIKRVDDAKN